MERPDDSGRPPRHDCRYPPRKSHRHGERPRAEADSAARRRDQRERAGNPGVDRRAAAREDGRVPSAPGRRQHARRPAARSVRGRTRGGPPRAEHAALRRPADWRHRPAPRQDRGNEDGRGQDPRGDAAGVPERPRRQGRARRHRQRLPRPPRLRVDGPDLPLPATSPTAPTTSSASTTSATT
jgi:hypothetical protein